MSEGTTDVNNGRKFFKSYIEDIAERILSIMMVPESHASILPPSVPHNSFALIQASAQLRPIVWGNITIRFRSLATMIMHMETFINNNNYAHPIEVLLTFQSAFGDILSYWDQPDGMKVYVPLILSMDHYTRFLETGHFYDGLNFSPFYYVLCLSSLEIRQYTASLLYDFINVLKAKDFGDRDIFALDHILVSILRELFSQPCYQNYRISIEGDSKNLRFAETKALRELGTSSTEGGEGKEAIATAISTTLAEGSPMGKLMKLSIKQLRPIASVLNMKDSTIDEIKTALFKMFRDSVDMLFQ